MCSSAPLVRLLLSAGAARVWPLDDTFGHPRELVAGVAASSNDLSRGDPALLPEYGSSTGFNGSSAYVLIPHAAALAPASAFAVSAVVQLESVPVGTQTIFRKENGGTGGRIAVFFDVSGGAVRVNVSANIGGTLRTVTRTITAADWVAAPRLVVARYDGANLTIFEAASGVVASTGSAYTGTVGAGTGTAIYLGSNSGASEWLSASVQAVGYWVNAAPSDAEIDGFAAAMVWEDLGEDVVGGVEWEYGIRDSGPEARLGGTGTLQAALDNSAGNLAGTLGYYSPGHVDARPGFGWGVMVRLSILNAATAARQYKFVGRLSSIAPVPGAARSRVTEIAAVDYCEELARARMPALPFAEGDYPDGLTSVEAIKKTIQYLAVHPHAVEASAAGAEVFPYGYDRAEDERDVAMQAIGRVIDSEMGWVFMRGSATGGGALRFESRNSRAAKLTPDYTISDAWIDLEVERAAAEVRTIAQVTVYPRAVGTVLEVLYSMDLEDPVSAIEPGATVTIRVPYTDPEERGQRVGGTGLVLPVAATDYAAVDAGGSGVSLTASLSVAFVGEAGANSSLLAITNGHGSLTAALTAFQLRGYAVRSYSSVTCEETDEGARQQYGDSVLKVDQPFQDEVTAGYGAARYLLAAYGVERTVARRGVLRAGPGSPADVLTAAISIEPGDLIEITESVTGLAAAHYFVNGVRGRLLPGNVIETELILAPREGTGWVLGVAGYSELGETTRLGY